MLGAGRALSDKSTGRKWVGEDPRRCYWRRRTTLPGVRTTYVGQESLHMDGETSLPTPTPTEQLCLAAVGLPWALLGSRKGVEEGLWEQGRQVTLSEGLEQLLQPGNLVLQRRAQSLPSPTHAARPGHGHGPSWGPSPL